MKKMLLATLLATLAGLSQAVTLTWTADSILLRGAPSGEWTGAAILSGAADSDLWVTTNLGTVSWGSLTTQTVTDLTSNNSTGLVKAVMRKNIGTGTAGNAYTNVSFDITLDSALDAGDYTLVIFAPGRYNSSRNNGSADAFNYTTFTVEDGWADISIAMGDLDLNTDLADRSVASTTVPEPTVLALLALGVAGVALRRRA